MPKRSNVTRGSLIRDLRLKNRLSQRQLAEKLFVQHTTISNWEKDIRSINLDQLEQIANIFNVPLETFQIDRRVHKSKQLSNKKGLRYIVGFSIVVAAIGFSLFPFNERMPVDSCFGEPSCYWIDDDALSLELTSRGLSEGKMTNVELTMVSSFLKTYIPLVDVPLSSQLIEALYYAHYQSNISYEFENSSYDWWMIHTYLMTYDPFSKEHYFLDLDGANTEQKQLFYTEDFSAKVVLYKTSTLNFTYEIWTDIIDVYKIDLYAEKLYLNNSLVDLSHTIPMDVIHRYVEILDKTRSWNVQDEMYAFQKDGERLYVFTHLHFISHTHRYYRFRYFDMLEMNMYYFEIYHVPTDGHYVNFQVLDTLGMVQETILSSRIQPFNPTPYVSLNTVLSQPDGYISSSWSIINLERFISLFSFLTSTSSISLMIEF
jgi:transcriptional regulator with XRE-family HTH domain